MSMQNPLNDTIYHGCGTTKTCFGLPTNCVVDQSCDAVVTAAFVNNRVQFELEASVGMLENGKPFRNLSGCINVECTFR